MSIASDADDYGRYLRQLDDERFGDDPRFNEELGVLKNREGVRIGIVGKVGNKEQVGHGLDN